jgi:HlyD family secretion protein
MKTKIFKIKSYFLAHKVIGVIVIVVFLGVSYGIYKKFANTVPTRYVTSKVEKGTIISSISGTGQVSALDQLDIKPKTSGDVVYISAVAGQKLMRGQIIAKLDDQDAIKAVRDAEMSLNSAQISLEKLKIEKSNENMSADLKKSFDDGFNEVSNVFLNLPGIMTGLNDMFFKSSAITQQQWNIDWYLGQVDSVNHDEAVTLKQNFVDSFNKAKKSYDDTLGDYKVTSRTGNTTAIEKIISETYETTKLVSDAIKNGNNYIDFVKSIMQKNNVDIPSMVETHRSTLNTYTSKTNSHLVNLLNVTTNIKNYKDAFPSADLDVKSSELSVKQRENALQDAKDQLTDYYVRAPFDGTLATLSIKKYDQINTGTTVGVLITKSKIAEISLNEVDVSKIKIGQKSTLTFDAIPDLSMSGEVTQIDTIGSVSQGVVTYVVKIGFDTQDERVKTGMSVSAAIITDVKSDVLLVPNSAVKSQNGSSYVEVFTSPLPLAESGIIGSPSSTPPNRVNVEVGLSNDSQTEIISGIKEGDGVVSRTILPNSNSTTTTPSLFGGGGGGNRVFQAR